MLFIFASASTGCLSFASNIQICFQVKTVSLTRFLLGQARNDVISHSNYSMILLLYSSCWDNMKLPLFSFWRSVCFSRVAYINHFKAYSVSSSLGQYHSMKVNCTGSFDSLSQTHNVRDFYLLVISDFRAVSVHSHKDKWAFSGMNKSLNIFRKLKTRKSSLSFLVVQTFMEMIDIDSRMITHYLS